MTSVEKRRARQRLYYANPKRKAQVKVAHAQYQESLKTDPEKAAVYAARRKTAKARYNASPKGKATQARRGARRNWRQYSEVRRERARRSAMMSTITNHKEESK